MSINHSQKTPRSTLFSFITISLRYTVLVYSHQFLNISVSEFSGEEATEGTEQFELQLRSSNECREPSYSLLSGLILYPTTPSD